MTDQKPDPSAEDLAGRLKLHCLRWSDRSGPCGSCTVCEAARRIRTDISAVEAWDVSLPENKRESGQRVRIAPIDNSDRALFSFPLKQVAAEQLAESLRRALSHSTTGEAQEPTT